MYRHSRPEEMDLASASLSRSHSVQSDRPSFSSSISLVTPPLSINPEPAYIAATVASQIVNDNCEAQLLEDAEANGTEPFGETALVTAGALKLVNAFLDQLLYNLFSTARSTALSPLRLAVSDVLRPKLAREAVMGADQELSEYLGDEGLSAFDDARESGGDWDLELVFKRSRLRCMVFCRLGEMEEDEGSEYIKEQQTDGSSTMHSGAAEVSPAVAIFLASVLEFIGEQSLVTGGQAAYKRLHLGKSHLGSRNHTPSPNGTMERVVVEEIDMEKVAFNSALGRLWRTWRSRVRSPRQSRSRPLSPGAYQQINRLTPSTLSREQSGATSSDNQRQERDVPNGPSVAEALNSESAANVALPLKDNDVEEIEVPGLALLRDQEARRKDEGEGQVKRPQSMLLYPPRPIASSTTASPLSRTPQSREKRGIEPTNSINRKRSRSLPTAEPKLFLTPSTTRSGARNSSSGSDSANNAEMTLTDQVGEQVEEHKGLVAGVIAGATAIGLFGSAAIGSAAIAGIAAAAVGEAPATRIQALRPSQDLVSGTLDNEEAEIVDSTRVSIDEVRAPTPVEIVRSRPRTSSSNKSFASPDHTRAQSIEEEPSSLVANEHGGEDDPTAIGIARTSNIPVAAMMVSPSRESLHEEVMNADESAWKEKRSSRFVLAAPPTSRSQRSSATSTPPAENVAPTSSTSLSETRLNTNENAALPLAPLREITESGAGPPNRANPLAETHASPKASHRLGTDSPTNGHPPRTDSTSFSPSLHNPISTHRSGRRQQSGTEKASVQRVIAPYATPSNAISPKHVKSISLSRDKDDKESFRTRSSNDGNGSEATQQDEKKQSFERLIQGDQTIQYTLTPQNMRKIEAPRSQTAELAEFLKNTVPPTESNPRPSTSRSIKSLHRTNGLRFNPSQDTPRGPVSPRSRPLLPEARANSISSSPTPRLPTYEKESTKDFADFIRSTGPDSGAASLESAQAYKSRPTIGIRYQQRPLSAVRSVSSPSSIQQTIHQEVDEINSLDSHYNSMGSSKSTRRLQPRGAKVSSSNSSELADFIREGPPPGRDVTPKLLVSSAASHQASSVKTKSEPSSLNSRTALLDDKNKMDSRQVTDKARQQMGFAGPGQSQRKQRRVKDPYAIDTDSDEDDDSKPTRKRDEESLMDFLRNVPPPSQTATDPPIAIPESQVPKLAVSAKNNKDSHKPQGTQKTGPRTLQKKPSGQGMASRFGRNHTSPKVAADGKGSTMAQPSTNGIHNRSASGAPQLALNGTGYSTFFPESDQLAPADGIHNSSTFNPTPPIDLSSAAGDWKENRVRGLAPPVAANNQLGSKGAEANRSNDLVEFLNAGPPRGLVPSLSPVHPAVKEETGFRQMFGRRKKKKGVVA